MALATDIKNRVGLYLSGNSTLQNFQEWLDHQETSGDLEAQKISHAIEWEFCDLERGALNAADLRGRLLGLASGRPQVAQVFVDSVLQQSPVLEQHGSFGCLKNFYDLQPV
jgi:hypothetical protein